MPVRKRRYGARPLFPPLFLGAVYLLQLMLFGLKIAGDIDWTWTHVFIPTIVLFVVTLMAGLGDRVR